MYNRDDYDHGPIDAYRSGLGLNVRSGAVSTPVGTRRSSLPTISAGNRKVSMNPRKKRGGLKLDRNPRKGREPTPILPGPTSAPFPTVPTKAPTTQTPPIMPPSQGPAPLPPPDWTPPQQGPEPLPPPKQQGPRPLPPPPQNKTKSGGVTPWKPPKDDPHQTPPIYMPEEELPTATPKKGLNKTHLILGGLALAGLAYYMGRKK